MKRLIIVEGVDGSGKTTLIEGLRRAGIYDYEFNYSYPREVTPDLCMAYAMGEYKASARIFKRLIAYGKTVVCDRFHLAEYAYGPIMRSYNERIVKQFIEDFEAYLITMVPHEKIGTIILKLHDSRTVAIRKNLSNEYPTTLWDLSRINDRYVLVPSMLDTLFITTDTKYNNHSDLVLKEVLDWIG